MPIEDAASTGARVTTALSPSLPWLTHRLLHLAEPLSGPYPLEAIFSANETWVVAVCGVAFVLLYGALLVRAVARPGTSSDVLRVSLAAALTYLLFSTHVSENHWTLALFVETALWAHDPREWQPFVAWAVILNATMLLTEGIAGVPPPISHNQQLAVRFALAVAAIVAYVAALRAAVRRDGPLASDVIRAEPAPPVKQT